jgi:hypothetical protein
MPPFFDVFCQRGLHWVARSFVLRFSQISDHPPKNAVQTEQNPANPHET